MESVEIIKKTSRKKIVSIMEDDFDAGLF